MSRIIARIRSGGQTGVDRAALDTARKFNIQICGWCPRGGWAEDFPEAPGILAEYPELKETPEVETWQRTLWNMRDADAADFSPLTDEAGNLFLSGAEHAAMVEIDEDGVTGAAYTALITEGAGMFEPEEAEFVLDRPFYFAVTGRDGSILFAGIVQTVE